jgi:hypothetical protein
MAADNGKSPDAGNFGTNSACVLPMLFFGKFPESFPERDGSGPADYLPFLAASLESAVTGLGSEIFIREPQTEQ